MGILSKVKNINIPIPSKVKLTLQKHAPDICIGAGIVLVVGSAVYACKKTLDAKDILEEADKDLKDIKYGEDIADGDEGFDAKVARSERLKVYRRTGIELAKCYGPSIIGGTVGIGLILKGHNIEKDRNIALTGAYASLLANYQAYREKVKKEVGEDKEFDIYSGASRETVEYTDEDGKKKKEKNAAVIVDDGSGHSQYARLFGPECRDWSKSPGANLTFLRTQQQFANQKLRSEGHLFLNDVYRALGFPDTPEGQIVGWMWDPRKEIEENSGDDYVDFGMYEKVFTSIAAREFVNGAEPCVWLDFNVDGVIYDLI